MPAVTILRLARTIRWASVASLTRNARAICGVVRPTTARRVSASRASGASAGWQQANSSASRSSVPDRSARRRRLGAGRQRRAAAPPRRTASSALRWAATWSQAPGRSGGPSRRQAVSASTTARLHRLLGEVEVAEAARQPGHQQAGLLAQGLREEAVGGGGHAGGHSNWR